MQVSFRSYNTSSLPGGSTLLDRIIGEIARTFAQLRDAVGNDRIVRVSLKAGQDNLVVHGLGAPPRSWEIVDKDAQSDVWRSTTTTVTAQAIVFRCSADVNALIRFN